MAERPGDSEPEDLDTVLRAVRYCQQAGDDVKCTRYLLLTGREEKIKVNLDFTNELTKETTGILKRLSSKQEKKRERKKRTQRRQKETK